MLLRSLIVAMNRKLVHERLKDEGALDNLTIRGFFSTLRQLYRTEYTVAAAHMTTLTPLMMYVSCVIAPLTLLYMLPMLAFSSILAPASIMLCIFTIVMLASHGFMSSVLFPRRWLTTDGACYHEGILLGHILTGRGNNETCLTGATQTRERLQKEPFIKRLVYDNHMFTDSLRYHSESDKTNVYSGAAWRLFSLQCEVTDGIIHIAAAMALFVITMVKSIPPPGARDLSIFQMAMDWGWLQIAILFVWAVTLINSVKTLAVYCYVEYQTAKAAWTQLPVDKTK